MHPLPYFPYVGQQMQVEGLAIEALAQQVPTPFYCYSSKAIASNYQCYSDAFAGLDSLICYAVKANSNQAILATLARLGAGADTVSEGEIRRALAAGISADKIVFAGVGKSVAEIRYALAQDILQFNVESEPELMRISEQAQSMGKRARVSIRVNPDVEAKTHAKITTGMAENKFGIAIDLAPALYKRAASLPGIEVSGVDVHIGSQLTELTPFDQAFSKVADLVTSLQHHGIDIQVIDIGGGLGINYGEQPQEPDITTYASFAKAHLAHLGCKIIVEPGRSILGNAGVLVSRVEYVKTGQQRHFLILDAAMNDLIRPSMYDAYHHIVTVTEQTQKVTYDIVGPVCETGDTFAKGRTIGQCQSGDLVAIMGAGAYGAVMASHYNSRLNAPEVLVKDDQYSIIRERIDYDTLIAMDSLPSWL
ncbi:diaminopimelate decarboxylase [Pseudoalteromonas sp. MM17-2]|uniref:diaminopimelate decarboxylase n=1 Tax=Pseudoalteromonas sp. MM17-2 TaxID=2917753 RepID=UPI001EF6C163|nr:diaminopimelate decarboxylase [Pseudoalteromonas sp. MM17-2]MCG7544289.1 diaminopimelate decarboxylase [Pseudoalteromonas sp. MM17-2]